MNTPLSQELLLLNQEFDHVIRRLKRMEQAPTYRKEIIRWARALVESAQVQANRQFFDEFDAIVANDAIGAYNFLRELKKRITDTDDIYLAIKQREAARKAKGLPARLVILPDWDFNDENRHEKEQAKKRKRAAIHRRMTTKNRKPTPARRGQRTTGNGQIGATPTHEGANSQ
jgi:hypothetical protein